MAPLFRLTAALVALGLAAGCRAKPKSDRAPPDQAPTQERALTPDQAPGFQHVTGDRFGDAAILRYESAGFHDLDLEKKLLIYHLSEAALYGRDIAYDQKYRHNLAIRRTLEALVRAKVADPSTENGKALLEYAKKVWFAGGIHHHYASEKFEPGFDPKWFQAEVMKLPKEQLPLLDGESKEDLLAKIRRPMFDPDVDRKRVELDPDKDPVLDSANNFYGEDLTAKEVAEFYDRKKDPKDARAVSHGLNSKLVREGGRIVERVWKVGGMYGPALERIVFHLKEAMKFAENEEQKKALRLLAEYYETGDLATFDAYSIAWVADTDSVVDTINGFIEVYGDAVALRGMFEGVVSFRDPVASKRIEALAKSAQWFEDSAPYLPVHKKKEVKGISARVITVVTEAGDAAPTTPIGINLPNADWIRAEHGSKSVSLGNIIHAYAEASKKGGTVAEFSPSPEVAARLEQHGPLANDLLVDLHEVIGHASGRIEDGVGTPAETLKTYASTLEEARADLVALYYLMDPKLIELGLAPSLEVGKAAYDNYIQNGLMKQLNRIQLGKKLEESHMRNRQMVAKWALEKGENVIERVEKGGKTYFVVNDHGELRELFGQLLREVQRIKSQGDFEAGKSLVETYGVEVDPKLHEEVLGRYRALDLPSYYGFIQPELTVEKRGEEVVDVKIAYPTDFVAQQMAYAERYGVLPPYN